MRGMGDGMRWKTVSPRADCVAVGGEAGTQNLRALASFVRDAARAGGLLLLVNDSHRGTRTAEALREVVPLLADLTQKLRIDLLVAAGTHRFDATERSGFERETLGATRDAFAAVHWHDDGAAGELAVVGGFRFHRLAAEATHMLAIGSVEPHYFAGVTGAHKTLTIGCASREDIARNHRGALHPASDVLRTRGNPVFDGICDMLGALHAAGKQTCAINQLVVGERLLAARAGDALQTLEELLPRVRAAFLHEAPAAFDALHLRVPPPLGRNLYQADKALKNNHGAVRDGGVIVLDAACEEGVGPNAFLHLLRRAATYREALACVEREGYRLGDHKAVKLRHLTDPAARGVRLAIVSRHISESEAATLGAALFAEAGEARKWAASLLGSSARGLVVEDAGNACIVPTDARGGTA
jgi:nickel-dependent lactate racemase